MHRRCVDRARTSLLLAALAGILFAAPLAQAGPEHVSLGLSAYEDPQLASELVHRLPDVQASFGDWEAAWPEFVERQVIGYTRLMFPLETIRITDEGVTDAEAGLAHGQKLRVYLDGGHHGNEFLGVDLVMYYLQEILEKAAAGDEDTLAFLARHELWATPIINVEGNFLDTRKNAAQVDVNRNYDYQWGGPGSGGFIFDGTYRGPSPHSEPEVAANAAFGAELVPDLWITMHTGVAEFYWPWGWTHDPAPDWYFFESLEEGFEAASNGAIDAMQAAELYLAAGATDDYGYAVVGVPTFTYEVHDDQFIPIYGQPVSDLLQDQLNALDWMVQNTKHLGAFLEPHMMDGGLHIYNAGWGNATNVTVSWEGGARFIETIPAGEMYVFASPPAERVTIEYTPLMIESSPTRTVSYHAQPGDGDDDNASPGVGVLAIAVVAAALWVRRRA